MLNLRLLFPSILILLSVHFSKGQISNSLTVNGNDIYTIVRNDGSMFWDSKKSVFKIPFLGNNSPTTIFISTLFVLALDENNKIFLSGDEYQGGYAPGPIYDDTYSATYEHTKNFNKIWSVDYENIQAHLSDFASDGHIDIKRSLIYSWPGKGNPYFKQYNGFEPDVKDYDLAPFYDQNGDGIYNPDEGDYPAVASIDKSVTPELITWCIFNNVQTNFRLEIGLTCWMMQCDVNPVLNKSFFCSYKIENKSKFKLKDVRAALFIDPDLGCYTDDYVGSIPVKNASFWYNADILDGDVNGKCDQGIFTYGNHPPVQSLVFLNHKLDVFMVGTHDNAISYPTSLTGYFYFFNAFFGDHSPLINPLTGLPVKHAFSDNPNQKDGWSMYALKIPPGDQRLFNVAAIGDLDYNKNTILDFAYIYHNDPDSNHVQNVNVAYDQIDQMQIFYNSGFKNTCNNSHCTTDCVWPGDTNNDGIVNYLDAVNIFKGYLENGTERKNIWIWKGQESLNWSESFTNGLNYKFADANGDKTISESDLELLKIYTNFKHGDPATNQIICEEGNDFKWKIILKDSILKTFIGLRLTLDPPAKNFQGVSFEIPIDPEFIKPNVAFSPKMIWQDTTVKVLSYIENASDPFDKSIIRVVFFNNSKKDELAATEVNWTLSILRNTLGNFPAPYYDLKVCNGRLYLHDGSIIPLKSQVLRIYNDKVVTVNDNNTESIFVYPQPATDQFTLSRPELVNSWNVYNMQGQLMKSKITYKIQNSFDIDFLVDGCYFIELVLDQRKVVQKMIVMRH